MHAKDIDEKGCLGEEVIVGGDKEREPHTKPTLKKTTLSYPVSSVDGKEGVMGCPRLPLTGPFPCWRPLFRSIR